MRRRTFLAAMLAALATIFAVTGVASALPAPPANDSRDTPTILPSLPAAAQGTTVGATVDPTDPPARCAAEAGSVWYQVTVGATAPQSLAIQVDARGDLDAAVDVFVKQRSQSLPVTCQRTDKHGEAVFQFTPQKNTTYLIRVAQLSNSVSGTFLLSAFVPPPPAALPGTALAPGGVRGSLARVVNASAAYSAKLDAGTSYVINLVSDIHGCMALTVYPPHTRSFSSQPAAVYGCQGYRLFTPDTTGVYSFAVNAAPSTIGHQPFRLQVAPAGADQTTPGVPLANYERVHAHLAGKGVQVQRLYRFDVTARSNLELDLRAPGDSQFDLELRRSGGRILDCACGESGSQTLTDTTRPGRYYVDVRSRDFSSGTFTLLRRSRAITYTAVRINASRYVVTAPGSSVTVSVGVTAHADGPASVLLQRFDPIAGWQYYRTVQVPITDGAGSFTFTPPSDGQFSARASFLGSRGFSPSESRIARVLSAGPLTEEWTTDG
jgi:hypothetical protein